MVSPPAGGDRSAASLGLSVAGLVRDAPPLSCSLIPNPQAVFLDAFRIPWGDLGIYALPPFLSSDGWWLQSGRPQSLHDSGGPRWLVEEWFADLPLSRGFPKSLLSWQGFSRSRQFRALSQPFTLSLPCRTWFARLIVRFSVFLGNSSKSVVPEELHPPPGVCPSRPSGLNARSVRSFLVFG